MLSEKENLENEQWKKIYDYDYSVSTYGRVRNDNTLLLLKPSLISLILSFVLLSMAPPVNKAEAFAAFNNNATQLFWSKLSFVEFIIYLTILYRFDKHNRACIHKFPHTCAWH